MKSEIIGTNTSDAEVLNVSPVGFWIAVGPSEHFLPFEHFPWFKNATVASIFNVQLLHGHHLYWPDLDVDLDLDCIQHPEKYPLLYKP